jgi:transcriptional regulator GlxA family with amidase domain
MDERVDAVSVFMKTNLRRKLSLDEMAKSVNLSPARLRQIFKAEVGVAPLAYLKALRIERAKELLENTFFSIKEIAGSVGMGDASHFVRNFQTAFGVTPARHRAHYLHTKRTRTGQR